MSHCNNFTSAFHPYFVPQMKVTMDISTNVLDLSKVSLTDMDKQRCSQQKRSHEQVMVEGEDDVSLQDFTVKKMKECNADGVGVTSPGAKKPCLGLSNTELLHSYYAFNFVDLCMFMMLYAHIHIYKSW